MEILEEDTRQEQELEPEMGLGDYDYDELTDSLARFCLPRLLFNEQHGRHARRLRPGNRREKRGV